MKTRIKRIRVDSGETQTTFAEKLGITRSAVQKLESGENNPSDALVKLIAVTYHVNYDWLLTGEGDQYVEADTVEQAVDRFMANASEFQRNTFKALAGMGDDQWIWLEKLVDSIAGQKKGD